MTASHALSDNGTIMIYLSPAAQNAPSGRASGPRRAIWRVPSPGPVRWRGRLRGRALPGRVARTCRTHESRTSQVDGRPNMPPLGTSSAHERRHSPRVQYTRALPNQPRSTVLSTTWWRPAPASLYAPPRSVPPGALPCEPAGRARGTGGARLVALSPALGIHPVRSQQPRLRRRHAR